MIEFYLTGSSIPDGFQNVPSASLGGYVSSALVHNGSVDELLGGISEFSKINKKAEYVMIAIKNTVNNKTNVNIKVINPIGSYSVCSIAVVLPNNDDDNNLIFEKIPEKSSQPYYADFAPPTGVNIALLKKGDVYGIWLKREISPAALIPVPTADLVTAFEANTDTESTDDVILDINYD